MTSRTTLAPGSPSGLNIRFSAHGLARLLLIAALPVLLGVGQEPYVLQTAVRRHAHVTGEQHDSAIPSQPLRTGDLVFRLGRSLGSHAVISIDPESRYSHVGILAPGDDSDWRVVHVMPQALTDTSPAQFELLTAFISADQAGAFAFYRLQGADSERISASAAENARDFYARGVVFNSHFDLSSDDAMYCTELVWKAYLKAGVDLVDGRLDALEGPFFSGLYVLPSTLQKSSALMQIQ